MKFNYKKYFLFVLIYLLVWIFCSIILINYEEHFAGNCFYCLKSMDISEKIAFILVKYFLNFPFGIFNYFTNDYMLTTFFFVFINPIILSNYRFFYTKIYK